MTEAQRKAIYAAGVAVLAALGAFGVVDGAMSDSILQALTGVLTIASVVVPIIARKNVGEAGVDDREVAPKRAA